MTPEEFQNKEIRGINIKQVAAYTAAIFALVFIYFDIKAELQINRAETRTTQEILRKIEDASVEDRKVREMQIHNLDQQQRETAMRITILETRLTSEK